MAAYRGAHREAPLQMHCVQWMSGPEGAPSRGRVRVRKCRYDNRSDSFRLLSTSGRSPGRGEGSLFAHAEKRGLERPVVLKPSKEEMTWSVNS